MIKRPAAILTLPGLKKIIWDNWNLSTCGRVFLCPRGPLFIRPSCAKNLRKNSRSPLKPYKSYQDRVRPLIYEILLKRGRCLLSYSDDKDKDQDKDKDKDNVLKRPNICYIFEKQTRPDQTDQTRPGIIWYLIFP